MLKKSDVSLVTKSSAPIPVDILQHFAEGSSVFLARRPLAHPMLHFLDPPNILSCKTLFTGSQPRDTTPRVNGLNNRLTRHPSGNWVLYTTRTRFLKELLPHLHLGAALPHLVRHPVYPALGYQHPLGPPEPPECGVGRLVAVAHPAVHPDIGHLVAVLRVEDGALQHREGEVQRVAPVVEQVHVERQDPALLGETHFVPGTQGACFETSHRCTITALRIGPSTHALCGEGGSIFSRMPTWLLPQNDQGQIE